MKKIFRKLMIGPGTSGFTMIELLVVIAVIGVLAVAVLSSINPIEQINKGRDTRLRSNAAQLLNAADRFYAIHEIYPWNDASYTALAADELPIVAFDNTATGCANASGTPYPTGFCQIGGTGYTPPAAPLENFITALTTTEEIKDSFQGQLEDTNASNALLIYKANDDDVYICFTPSSKAFQLDSVKQCETKQNPPPGSCANSPYSASSVYIDELICLP